jgi:hypothetical protein
LHRPLIVYGDKKTLLLSSNEKSAEETFEQNVNKNVFSRNQEIGHEV